MSFPGENGFVRVDAEDDYDVIEISNIQLTSFH